MRLHIYRKQNSQCSPIRKIWAKNNCTNRLTERQTDGQTDGQDDSNIPSTLFAGEYMYNTCCKYNSFSSKYDKRLPINQPMKPNFPNIGKNRCIMKCIILFLLEHCNKLGVYFKYLIFFTLPFQKLHTKRLSCLSTHKPKGLYKSQLSVKRRSCPFLCRMWIQWFR